MSTILDRRIAHFVHPCGRAGKTPGTWELGSWIKIGALDNFGQEKIKKLIKFYLNLAGEMQNKNRE